MRADGVLLRVALPWREPAWPHSTPPPLPGLVVPQVWRLIDAAAKDARFKEAVEQKGITRESELDALMQVAAEAIEVLAEAAEEALRQEGEARVSSGCGGQPCRTMDMAGGGCTPATASTRPC